MQLKGLVRFFTILLIIYSLYQLSFTWFVRGHEKKMEAKAKSFVTVNYPAALAKYPNNKDSQEVYQEVLDKVYQERLKRLLDSTKDVTVTYGITGAISYQKAKAEELNLGLDLQGGMNVTLEVEMTGLLKTLSNNSKDPNFLKALENADKRKANSDANFVNLFAEEYEKLNPNGKLSSLFTSASAGKVTLNASNSQVRSYLEEQAKIAFDNNFRVLTTRIDQFGVAQPNINPDRNRGIINIELPGIQDKERVRKYLQSSANLQFWEVYNLSEISQQIQKADEAFYAMMGGKAATQDTTPKNTVDTAGKTISDTNKLADTGNKLSDIAGTQGTDTGAAQIGGDNAQENDAKKRLAGYIGFSIDNQGRVFDNGVIGSVLIKDTGLVRSFLQSEAVRINLPSELVWMYGIPEKKASFVPLYAIKTYGRDKPKLEGEVITSASMDYDQSGNPEVKMNMNNSGSRIWADITRANKGRFVAIALDNIVYSAPRVNDVIEGGTSSISGGFTVEEAQDLAKILSAGKLSVPAKIVQEQQVGPTLGSEAIKGGVMAFAISFVVIFLLMLIYYNTSGWVANIALILNLLFTVGVLAGLGATLTAPGIAGLVLTIGMAVDTNVIIYERIKEELTKGKGYIPAINEGYRRSLPPVLDGHITTLLTAIILFYFGLGPVKGFATTQILGILLSLFCGILVSRWITDIFTSKKRHLEYFTGISRKIFQHAKFKFIEFRKYAYGISFVVLALGIASYFNGFDYGVEFDGGRSYTVRFDKAANVEQVRTDLRAAFQDENPVIKTVGDKATLDITTAYLIRDTRPDADSLVEVQLYTGLKNHLPANLTFEQFDTRYKQGSKKVLPTISDDLKKGAIKATLFALVVIFLYIFIRFRDWRYSMGTIFALLHDVLVTLIVFSFARKIVPFPLEIDQHFIAALLTVIGFSMNDTVIIFDRIREDRRLYPSAPLADTINRAINETMSRTIMTSLTVFLTILILFIFGGEVTRGFAFAMLIGVITGIYSSVFVAAPILLDLGSGKKSTAGTTSAGVKATAPAKPATANS
ncbi:MAG: protein translocase subunit SecDF [Chitinophagaceae bacterium]|nr:protein translocase subunit SecDF [Chitinophagaceae bacterium]